MTRHVAAVLLAVFSLLPVACSSAAGGDAEAQAGEAGADPGEPADAPPELHGDPAPDPALDLAVDATPDPVTEVEPDAAPEVFPDPGADTCGPDGSSNCADVPDLPQDTGPIDTGPDCEVVGCARAPACAFGCQSPCGCCGCVENSLACDPAFPGSIMICQSGCYTDNACSTGYGCVETTEGPNCVPVTVCAKVDWDYTNLTVFDFGTKCGVDGDCHIVSGECGHGLGGCWHAVNQNVTQGELDHLGSAWADNGCGTVAICKCAPPPASATCEGGKCQPLF